MRQTFRQDEAEQILVEAVRRSDELKIAAVSDPGISAEKLKAMADELGVSPETLEAVLRERETAAVTARTEAIAVGSRQDFIDQRRADFMSDLWSYLGVNGTLIVIWLVSSPHAEFWPKWWLLWWGLILFFHGVENLPTRGSGFEKAFANWQDKQERRSTKRAAKARRRSERNEGA